MRTELDLAYAAGVIDCDGSISIKTNRSKRRNPSFSAMARVSNTKLSLVQWFRDTFGGSFCRNGKNNGHPFYQWAIHSQQARQFLNEVLPFLKLKQKQAMIAIELQEGLYISDRKNLSEEELEKRFALKEAIHKLNRREEV